MSEPFVPSAHKETISKPPSQDIPVDNVIPEEVYQREKGTEEFMMENPDTSHISDDYYWNEETKPNVFKNALVNLSEGLASMHRKDILNNADPNRKNSTNKPKNFNIKSGSNSRRRLHSGRSKQSQKENLETIGDNPGSLMQQTEPNLLENKGMSNRPSAFLQEIDLKTAPYQTLEDDDNKKLLEDSPPQNLNTSLHQDDKLLTEHSDDEPVKDYPQSENILKSAKVSVFENEVASANQLEGGDYESEKMSSGNISKKYSVVIKKSKAPVGQRSVRQLQQDDLRINKTLLQTKQVSSPLEAISIGEVNKPIKRDSIPLPVPQNPKNVAFIKELQNRNPHLKIDGIGQRLRQKENEFSENFNLKKRVLGEPLEVRSNNTSVRAVLGQAFKDAEAPPLFSLNLKGTSIGKKESKENIKESVDYILGLYKEKNPEKMRLFEMNPSRESIKATESLKRTSYLQKAQPLKEKVINQEEIVNRTSLKQHVTGIGFKLKKSTGNEFDDKKMMVLSGTVKLNENAFQ